MANLLGKRYVCATCGGTVLVTKPGEGGVECHGAPMGLAEAKPLPASD